MNTFEPPIFEYSGKGKIGADLPDLDVPEAELPADLLRDDELAGMPELSETEVMRHFTRISQRNFCIDTGMYPLGICTMKYNPKVHEEAARLPGFAAAHPLQDAEQSQGALRLMYRAAGACWARSRALTQVSLQPAAGAQGEFTGVLVFRAYHRRSRRRPSASRSCARLGPRHQPGHRRDGRHEGGRESRPTARGNVDLDDLQEPSSAPRTAGLMLTNPNTLGLFDEHMREVARLVHEAGGLMYGDGANFNAILGIVKPRRRRLRLHALQPAQDLYHAPRRRRPRLGRGRLHSRAGAVPARPASVSASDSTAEDELSLLRAALEKSIGPVKAFCGNFGMLVRAYTYIRTLGAAGLREVSENAVLNANYLRVKLQDTYPVAYDRTCMHEVVLKGQLSAAPAARTLDIAKRLIDYGFHPPTVYFPLSCPRR